MEKVQPVSKRAMKILAQLEDPDVQVCLVSTLLDGKNVDVIARMEWEGPSGDVVMTPLAIVVSDDLFDRLSDPSLV